MSDFVFYHYQPSTTTAAVFCGLFGLTTAIHAYQLCATKSWHMVPLCVGALCETVGFLARAVSASQSPDYGLGPYIIQSLLVLVAPVIMVASIYMMFGYIILAIDGDGRSVLRESLLTKLFVTGDVLAFMVQSTGAGLMAKPEPESQDAGKYITVGGLILQLLIFGFFMIISVMFYYRITRKPTVSSWNGAVPWKRHLWAVYFASILVMIRSVFRLVEYLQGNDGSLMQHEVWLYALDAGLMLAVAVLFNVLHPAKMRYAAQVRQKTVSDADRELFG